MADVRMYDFGADCGSISSNERRAIAWPVAVWACYIPESQVQDINILEHLILQLVNKDIKNCESILCGQMGFNKELISAAIESCRNKGYLDKRFKELILSTDGKGILGKFDNPFSSDLEASKNSKKVYILQDLVTKSVIPVFNISKLPDYYIEDNDAIKVKYCDFTGKKPKSAAMKAALKYWSKLRNYKQMGLNPSSSAIDFSEENKDCPDIEGFIPFEDEVGWEKISENGDIQDYEVRTLADKGQETAMASEEKEISNITIIDDFPEQYYARGFLAINRNAPDEILIISPFGDALNDWFRTVINRLRASDAEFEDEIQLFLMLKREDLKGKIAFGNDLKIKLFDEFPFIANDNDFKAVKKAIRELTICKNRFENGENETVNFARSMRTSIEAMLRLVFKKNPYLLDVQGLTVQEYRSNLRQLVSTYPFLKQEISWAYGSQNIYNNMTQCSVDDGYATAYFSMILLDAWKNRNGKSMDLLRNVPEMPFMIKDLVAKGGNTASHGSDAFADLDYSKDTALGQYIEFEDIVRAIYSRFMEEEK